MGFTTRERYIPQTSFDPIALYQERDTANASREHIICDEYVADPAAEPTIIDIINMAIRMCV
jgi:hypothetical protein